MKKGETMILDGAEIAHVVRGGTRNVMVVRENGSSEPVRVPVARLRPALRPATDVEIFPGAELWVRMSETRRMKVTVVAGDLRAVNRSAYSGRSIVVTDALRNRGTAVRPDDLYVDDAARIRSGEGI